MADGYATVEDVDIGLRDGIALRWSFMGPFETIDLNTPGGVRDFVARCKEHWQMNNLKGNTKVWIYHLLKSTKTYCKVTASKPLSLDVSVTAFIAVTLMKH